MQGADRREGHKKDPPADLSIMHMSGLKREGLWQQVPCDVEVQTNKYGIQHSTGSDKTMCLVVPSHIERT